MLHIEYYNDNIVIDYQIANYNLKKTTFNVIFRCFFFLNVQLLKGCGQDLVKLYLGVCYVNIYTSCFCEHVEC